MVPASKTPAAAGAQPWRANEGGENDSKVDTPSRLQDGGTTQSIVWFGCGFNAVFRKVVASLGQPPASWVWNSTRRSLQREKPAAAEAGRAFGEGR